jgi:pullulanase/glycogen debranching enzyme
MEHSSNLSGISKIAKGAVIYNQQKGKMRVSRGILGNVMSSWVAMCPRGKTNLWGYDPNNFLCKNNMM